MSDESLLSVLKTSASGLSAERTRLNVIANNLANINTTRAKKGGGPYRRKQVVFETVLADASEDIEVIGNKTGKGVRVAEIKEDMGPLKMVYDPHHPDADQAGYLALPNVNVTEEMVDLITASRAYEANVAVIKATKNMLNKSLEIGKR